MPKLFIFAHHAPAVGVVDALADLLFSPEEEFEGALGAMADTWSWQSLVGWVSPLVVVVLTFILPRLFQRELRRLQLVSETRVKRLEALEKAMSLVGNAKSELEVKVTTDELQNELRRILHEFAGPVVLSREALEEWENDVPMRRFFITPRFSAPTKEARYVRGMRKFSLLGLFMFLLYFIMEMLSRTLLNDYRWREGFVLCVIWGIFYLAWRLAIFRESKSALDALRAMPQNTAGETPVIAASGLLPEAIC